MTEPEIGLLTVQHFSTPLFSLNQKTNSKQNPTKLYHQKYRKDIIPEILKLYLERFTCFYFPYFTADWRKPCQKLVLAYWLALRNPGSKSSVTENFLIHIPEDFLESLDQGHRSVSHFKNIHDAFCVFWHSVYARSYVKLGHWEMILGWGEVCATESKTFRDLGIPRNELQNFASLSNATSSPRFGEKVFPSILSHFYNPKELKNQCSSFGY